MSLKINCPACEGNHWYVKIGRANGGSYTCRGCGNIEQGIKCVECGCREFFSSSPVGYITRCKSCQCRKEPTFDSLK